jgi:hypothetical protein
MGDQANGRWRWRVPAWIAVGLLAYALSLGPASFLVSRGYLPQDPSHPVTYRLTMFYYPLNLMASAIPPLDNLKEWYVQQWIKRPRRVPPAAGPPRSSGSLEREHRK